jgi:hypothetical protein
MQTEAKTVSACGAVHNFIRTYDPDDIPEPWEAAENAVPLSACTGALGTGGIAPAKTRRATQNREKIAQAMWVSYQEELQRKGHSLKVIMWLHGGKQAEVHCGSLFFENLALQPFYPQPLVFNHEIGDCGLGITLEKTNGIQLRIIIKTNPIMLNQFNGFHGMLGRCLGTCRTRGFLTSMGQTPCQILNSLSHGHESIST